MTVKMIITLLILASASFAQMSTQDAEQRLRERQEQRADPSSIQALQSEISTLKAEIARLKAQIASIKAERDRMASELSQRGAATRPAAPASIEDAIRAKKLALGMTLDQARQAMGADGKLVDQTQDGETWAWEKFATHPNHVIGSGPLQRMVLVPEYLYTQIGEFDAKGKLVAIRRDIGQDLAP